MDLDVCVDASGNPYLGHSEEYHEKSGDPWKDNMPLWEAVGILSDSDIPLIIDCKHFNAWPVVEQVIVKLREERCLVHTFASELHFDYDPIVPDYVTEWSPIEKALSLKDRFPSVTTCVSAKGLPKNSLISDQYEDLLKEIRRLLKDNCVDTLCLNVPDDTFSDETLRFFLSENIIPHVGINGVDTTELSQVYIGETDYLEHASRAAILDQ